MEYRPTWLFLIVTMHAMHPKAYSLCAGKGACLLLVKFARLHGVTIYQSPINLGKKSKKTYFYMLGNVFLTMVLIC